MKHVLPMLTAALSLTLATNIAHAGLITQVLSNTSFEQPAIATNSFAPSPTNVPGWTFVGSTGLVNGNGGLPGVWPTAGSSGNQYADIGNNNSTGRVEQNFTVPAGFAIRNVSWNSNTAVGFTSPFIVKVIDFANQAVPAFSKADTVVSGGGWRQSGVTPSADTFGPGNYQIELSGTAGTHNADVLIDNVRVLIEKADPALSASGVNFGNTLVGVSKGGNVRATNNGDAFSTLTGNIGASANSKFQPTSGAASFSLGKGQSQSRAFTYTPTVRGSDSTNITTTSNAGTVVSGLSGTGVAPIRSVNAAATNAGLVRIGTNKSLAVGITNVGDGNQSGAGSVSNLRGNAGLASGNAEFSGSASSFSLADGAGTNFGFVYAPTNRGADTRNVNIDFLNGSTDGRNNASHASVSLTGTGVGPEFFSSVPVGPASGIDFGKLLGGTSASRSLEISNITTDAGGDSLTGLTLLGFRFLGPDAGLFDLSGFTPGMVLSKGAQALFQVIFNANSSNGIKNANLVISTDQGAAFGQLGREFSFNMQANVVPEPSSLVLLGIGAVCLIGYRRKRRSPIGVDEHSLDI